MTTSSMRNGNSGRHCGARQGALVQMSGAGLVWATAVSTMEDESTEGEDCMSVFSQAGSSVGITLQLSECEAQSLKTCGSVPSTAQSRMCPRVLESGQLSSLILCWEEQEKGRKMKHRK